MTTALTTPVVTHMVATQWDLRQVALHPETQVVGVTIVLMSADARTLHTIHRVFRYADLTIVPSMTIDELQSAVTTAIRRLQDIS